MEKITRLYKVAIAIFAILLLGVIGGFVTTVEASDIYEDVAVIETENNISYTFYSDGYRIGNNSELVEFTGTYVLTGTANTNVTFTCNDGESATYNVILVNWDAYADLWDSLLSVDEGVTLNLIVHGKNRIFGYNHAGIAGEANSEDGTSTVNITILENSKLEIGYQYVTAEVNIHHSVNITVNPEATSSPDISVDGWRNERNVSFSRGNAVNHTTEFEYVDDSVCRMLCLDCELVLSECNHQTIAEALDSADEGAMTKHAVSCVNCKSSIGLADHTLACNYEDEENHVILCEECGFVTSYTEHNRGENGCADCNSSYAASVTADMETTNYFDFESAVEAINISGGDLKLLSDVTCESAMTITPQQDCNITIDLNGFLLTKTSLSISKSNCKIKVIDSSEDKTGVFLNQTGRTSTCQEGVIEYNGITIHDEGISVIVGPVIFNNVKVKGEEYLEVYIQSSDATVEFTEVYAESPIKVKLHLEGSYNGNVVFNSGEYQKLEIETYADIYPGGVGVTFMDMLAQGYAFADENGIVDANTIILNDVVIVEHIEHVFDEYSDNGHQHAATCVCGKTDDGNVPEAHTLGQNGLCTVCGIELQVVLSDNEGEKYFSSVNAAFDYANGVESATIKLLCDAEYTILEVHSDITLDLNGYTLIQKLNRIYIYNNCKLTVCDTSDEQTGFLSSGKDLSYLFEINNQGSLVVNGGKILGLIYTRIFGSDETASIEINGGKFIGAENFRLEYGATLVINGGWFENKDSTIDYSAGSGINVTINGGTFVNCTLINENSAYLPTASELLGTDSDCELIFVDEYGNEIASYSLNEYYEGRMIVAHRGVTLVGDEDGHSLLCGECEEIVYYSEHHSLVYTENEDNKAIHSVVCGVCEQTVSTEQHSGGVANCTELAICEYCEAEYGSVDSNIHAGGEATCINQAVCKRCGTPYGELNESNHETAEYEYVQGENADEHNKIYACCGAIINIGKHENGVADCTNRGVCTVCDLEYGSAPEGHKYTNNCDASCNVCGAGREISGHVYDNSCDTECNECRIARDTAHSYGADGKCILCGLDGGTPQAEPKKPMGAGGIIGIIIATLAVFGGGSFALIWFVIRKKK